MKTFQARTGFPVGTLLVNLLGCLIIGFLGGWSATSPLFSPKLKLFLIIGILGSFTTFSTFGYDTLCLLQENNTLLALANVGAHMLLGLLCVYAGYTLSTLG